MAVFDPTDGGAAVAHAGTFNANPLTMVAGEVIMNHLTPSVYERMDNLGLTLREQLQAVYVHGADSSTSITRTKANLAGRKAILKKIRSKRLIHMQPEAACRESYRIQGETVITHKDYTSGRVFKDAVCFAFYPVDLHTRGGVKPKPLTKGVVPTVPLRALVPKNSRNIIVAGRSVSSDRLANSGLRVQASCMAMGQAAGAAAALAAQKNATPLEIPLEDIRELLRKHRAIVPGA